MDIIKYVSRFLQIAVFLGFGKIVRFSDCLTLSGDYGQNSVTFKCVISPYTSSQTWDMNSVTLAFCGAISCTESASNPTRYSFTTDLLSGKFTFNINPIDSNDTNKIVECSDGTDTKQLTIITDKDQNNTTITNTTSTTVVEDGTSDGFCSTTDGECILFIHGCIIFFCLWLIGLIRCCCNCCCNGTRSKKDDIIKCINVLLCIPILGVIVVIYSYLHRKTCNLDPPDPPKNFAKIRSTDTTITVQWIEGFDNGYKQTFYVYINEDKYKVDSTCTDGEIWSYTFKGLKSGTNYRIKIKAKNFMGSSEDSLDCRTKGALANTQYGGSVVWE